jgi:2-hydroxy-3-keto-5-methylthiopentenyl-1-phosphate phosphatase
MGINVICDFDGTIALADITDCLLERFADASWRQVESQWLAGEFGSRECMARQVALIQADLAELNRYLDTVAIDPTFGSFIAACERSGLIALSVVSDGIDYAVRRVLANHGFARLRVRANALAVLPGGHYRLEFPYSAPGCGVQAGTCKCAIASARSNMAPDYSPTIVIGDGTSDFCVASRADLVFAKDRLLAHCRANAITHLPFTTFADIEHELAQVIADFDRSLHRSPHLTETPSDA